MWHTARRVTLRNSGGEHEEEILLHQAAKNAFDEMGVKKLPKVKELQTEYAKLLEEKKRPMPSTGVPVRKCGSF